MRRIRTVRLTVLLLAGLLALSCGGGGNPILVTDLIALFVPTGNPSVPPRISMEAGAATGDTFSVEIHAEGITDLYGVAFTLLYPDADIEWLGCEADGSILSTSGGAIACNDALTGGARFAATLQNGVEGILNVRASKDGLVGGVNVDGLLLTLTFRAIGSGTSDLEFEAGPSREITTCPQDLGQQCDTPTHPFDEGSVIATDS